MGPGGSDMEDQATRNSTFNKAQDDSASAEVVRAELGKMTDVQTMAADDGDPARERTATAGRVASATTST